MNTVTSSSGGRITPFVLVFFVLDLVLAAAYLIYFWTGEPFWIIRALLDLDGERSIAAWYSSMRWLLVALLAAVYSASRFELKEKRSWPLAVLPLLFLFLSMDEIVQIHEWIGWKTDALLPGGTREGTPFFRTGIWMFLIGLPFFAGFLLFMRSIRTYMVAVPGTTTKLVAGMTIFIFGALGIETYSNVYSDDLNHVSYRLAVACEELFEMVGATVVLWGVYDLAKSRARWEWRKF